MAHGIAMPTARRQPPALNAANRFGPSAMTRFSTVAHGIAAGAAAITPVTGDVQLEMVAIVQPTPRGAAVCDSTGRL
jgi:hypothetical protein